MENNKGLANKGLSDDEIPGFLSLVELSDEGIQVLLDYLDSRFGSNVYSFVYAVIGKDQFLKFLDILSGVRFVVPRRDQVIKYIVMVKIYNYCCHRGFSEESYYMASKIFQKRVNTIKSICSKVSDRVKEIKDE